MKTLYTIGYGNTPIDIFLPLLQNNNIDFICDVRSYPYGGYIPDYSRDKLEKTLNTSGIQYLFLGKELGGRVDDTTCYVDNQIDYELVAKTTLFQEGIKRVVKGMEKFTIALLCAEKDPINCHRSLLITRHIALQHTDIKHIHHDGKLESHTEFENRLQNAAGIESMPLFDDEANKGETLNAAYKKHSKKVAFTIKDDAK